MSWRIHKMYSMSSGRKGVDGEVSKQLIKKKEKWQNKQKRYESSQY